MWTLLLFLSVAVVLGYAAYMFRLALAWRLQPKVVTREPQQHISLTVIIAVRNEAHRISGVLESLLQQDLKQTWQLILSDDHSEDNTVAVVMNYRQRFLEKGIDLLIVRATEGSAVGKKAALERAIAQTNHRLILTTDADTRMGPRWIRSIWTFYEETGARMIVPLTELDPGKRFLTGWQALEFAGLNASGAASLIAGNPLLCNGANLAFTRDAFIDAGGYTGNVEQASGDDTFLMLSVHQRFPGSVRFLKNRDAVVTAAPALSWKELFSQRIRWITKVKHYRSGSARRTGLLVAAANLMLLCLLAGCVAGAVSCWVLLSVLFIRIIAELSLLIPVLGFLRRQPLLLLFLPAAIVMPFYFVISGWFLFFPAGYRWKDRSYRS